MEKKVSLILTSYNCKQNIIRTLKSIEMQDYYNIEVVVVDGLSTDGTVDIIKAYAAKTKYMYIWISEQDQGIYDAMNKGLKLASGDIIAFFNDLFLESNAVSLMVAAIENGNYDGAHADLIYAEDKKVIRYWRMGEGKISNGWMPGHPTLYLKREIYDKYGMYNTEYKCSADYEFMIRMLKDGTVRLSYVHRTIIRMFYGGTSTNSAKSYWTSVKEAHHALVVNGIKGAWWIVFLRTMKVVFQFLRAGQYNGKISEE